MKPIEITLMLFIALMFSLVVFSVIEEKKKEEKEKKLFEKRKDLNNQSKELYDYQVGTIVEKTILRDTEKFFDFTINGLHSFEPLDMPKTYEIKILTDDGKQITEKLYEKFFNEINLGDKILVKNEK